MLVVNNYIRLLDNPQFKRLFFCGDIHGEYKIFIRALKKLGFNFDEDLVICTGDLVDRGKKNLEVINLLNEKWFMSIRGNHDQMCIEGLSNTKMKQIHKDPRNGGEWFYKLSDDEKERIFSLFSDLPFIMEINFKGHKLGVVHGDIHVNDWEQFKNLFLQPDTDWIERLQNNIIWGRTRIEHHKKGYTAVEGIDAIFLGHTIVKEITQLDNCYYIDTGAYHTGNLSFAIVDESGIKLQTVKGKKS